MRPGWVNHSPLQHLPVHARLPPHDLQGATLGSEILQTGAARLRAVAKQPLLPPQPHCNATQPGHRLHRRTFPGGAPKTHKPRCTRVNTTVPTDTIACMRSPATVLAVTDACAKTCSIATSTTEKLDGVPALRPPRCPPCTVLHALQPTDLPSPRHGLKFQALSLPIGMCVLHGPMPGPDHDATILRLSSIEEDLHTLTTEHRLTHPAAEPFCVYGDTAYPDRTHVLRATQHAVSTPPQRALNDIYKPLRVLVEQNFSCISQLNGIVSRQLSLGSGPLGSVYPVSALISNIHALLYGNTVSASVPGAHDVLQKISLSDYLHV